MKSKDISIVICCAGMGTRLGIGTTKALVNVCGKPLILHQLNLLKDYDDIRIVVGYQAEKVIQVVNTFRRDIMYAFNYEYKTTGVADSLIKGSVGARKYTVVIDGDLLVNQQDLHELVDFPGECIGSSIINSEEPIYIKADDNQVVGFSTESGELEWSGIAKIETAKLVSGKEHVYEIIDAWTPLPMLSIRSREIDTPEDYEKMIEWFSSGCQ